MTTNDRFQFRAWHIRDKIMLTVTSLKYYHQTLHSIYGVHRAEGTKWEYEYEKHEFVLMQSTGLKDKNKNLIFEGDVIINRRSRDSKAQEDKWIVEFGEHVTSSDYYASQAFGFYARKVDIEEEASLLQIYDEIEVVGNIWENPELLKTTKE